MLDDLKKVFGEKGVWIVLGVGVVLFVVALFLGDKTDGDTMVTPTGYTSYPDAITNANTIIDSVNQYTAYTGDRIIESTGGYMEEGLKNLQGNIQTSLDEIDSSYDSILNSLSTMNRAQETTSQPVKQSKPLREPVNTIKSNRLKVQSRKSTMKTPQQLSIENPGIPIPVENPTSTTAKTTTNKQYYNKTNYTGTSLVDGLKSVGVYSIDGKNVGSWNSRKELAAANGIKNYTGTAAQNTTLLNKLKAGTLVKPA